MMTIRRETAHVFAENVSVTARRAAGWLSLAAAPTFALMAWIAANDVHPFALCFAGSRVMPIGGMTTMYLLMSLFHLSPWLKLTPART